MTDVGAMYCDGIDTPQDYEQARFWFTKAATEDHSAAEWFLRAAKREMCKPSMSWVLRIFPTEVSP